MKPKPQTLATRLQEAATEAGATIGTDGPQGIASATMTLVRGLETPPEPKEKTEPIRGGLTYKQDTYAKLRANGLTKADAYRQAYDTANMKEATIHHAAFQLETNSKIRDRIRYHEDTQDRLNQHDPMRLRVLVLDTLVSIAADTSQKASDRNRSAELLGKVRGVDLFKDADPNQTAANVQTMTDLSNRLRAFIDARTPQPIEGQAVLVSDTEANDRGEPSGMDNLPEPETPSS